MASAAMRNIRCSAFQPLARAALAVHMGEVPSKEPLAEVHKRNATWDAKATCVDIAARIRANWNGSAMQRAPNAAACVADTDLGTGDESLSRFLRGT
jgi:hypothetical protein